MPEELQEADVLLGQADALLHRHRDTANLMTASDEDVAADDLPLLTEVVEPAPAPPPTAAPTARIELTERLARLDALIAREVESWLADELPKIVATELERLSEQVRYQALAHMRTTVLPALSRRIATALDPEADPQT